MNNRSNAKKSTRAAVKGGVIMRRLQVLITCLILAVPMTVQAGEKDSTAVEAMREVWKIEEGGLADGATEEKLKDVLRLIPKAETKGTKDDLYKMASAAKIELIRQRLATKEEIAPRSYFGNCRITFYCGCAQCCGKWGNATASGATPTAGWTVANGSLPFGTRVIIDGHEYCVEDRGVGADQFDIYVNDHAEALARGLYYADVYIVE